MALKHTPVRLAIVGGGAAGLFAAAVAAERGISTVLIERKARLGSKVLMTANGRCNFTKDIPAEEFLADLVAAGDDAARRFVTSALRECPPRTIMNGFRSLGVQLRRMSDGRMFPADGKATTIVHAFGDLLRDHEVPVLTNCPVTGLQPMKNGFIVATKNFTLWAENVLLATGGVSYPKLGSVGDGQEFARALGHRIVPYRAGLIGLETADPRVTRRAGQRFEDGLVKVFGPSVVPPSLTPSEPHLLFEYRGEIDCETFGLSGAAVYNAQRFIEHYVRMKAAERGAHGVSALPPANESPTNRSGLHTPPANESKLRENLTVEVAFDRERLALKGLSPRPLKEAIVTIGGVALDDVDPATMESRKVPHLYFAGEVLDLDGPTGGYNLTLAFATARKAVASLAPGPEGGAGATPPTPGKSLGMEKRRPRRF